MSSFWKLYNLIERRFFFTLTRKIVGNIAFLSLFQAAAFFLIFYEALFPPVSGGEFSLRAGLLFSLSAVCTLFTIFYLNFLIVRPVKVLLKTLEDINDSRGDLSARLPAFTYDEFQKLSEAYNNFAENLGELIEKIYQDAAKSSQANQNMSDIVESVSEQVVCQKSLSDEIDESTQKVADSISNIVSASDQVATINQKNLANTDEANHTLVVSQKQVEQITALLKRFSATVDGLKENSDNVRNILRMVEGFAEQTNLLALNAAIEAARAGEAGRGFAVVADEVRTLSAKVADATQQISQFLNDMEKLVTETYQETSHLTEVSDEMRENIGVTTDTFSSMINDFKENMDEFSLIMTSVEALQHQHQATSQTSQQITELSNAIQQKMQSVNQGAEQAKSLANITQQGLTRFVDH